MLPSLRRPFSLRIAPLHVLSTVLGLLLIGGLGGCSGETPAPDERRVYVGTGSGDPDNGIYAFQFDPSTGALSGRRQVVSVQDPTYLTLAPDGRHLYSVNRTPDTATVAAYAVDASTGDLTLINAVPAEGEGPCYVSMDASGRWVLTANYGTGNLAVFPVRADGGLDPAAQVVQHTGSGPNPERQTAPHAHYVRVDPQNRHVLAADLGIDQVRVYPFDAERGILDTARVRVASMPAGMGPRHLAFHPNGRYVYVIGELSGAIQSYEYDADTGRMTAVQTVPTVPDDFEGEARSADIHVHPSGDILYASNRGDANDLVYYRIDENTGRLTRAGRQRTHVDWPRNFALSPRGDYLLVANRRADTIAVFRVDPSSGALSYTGSSVTVPSPTRIAFAPGGE